MTIEEMRKLVYITQGRATMCLADDPEGERDETRALFAKANFYAGISYVLSSVKEQSADVFMQLLTEFVDFDGLEGDRFPNHIFDKESPDSDQETHEVVDLPDAFKDVFKDENPL